MQHTLSRLLPTLLVFGFLTTFASADTKNVPTYWKDVRPVLRKNCSFCHSSRHVRKLSVSGGLVLDTYENIFKGTKGKTKVLKVGDSSKSLMIQLLFSKNPNRRMPLDGDPLPEHQVALLKRWIDTGAKEGTPPVDIAKTPTRSKPRKRRFRDVVLPTTTTPLRGIFGKGTPRLLDLRIKVGPLAPVTAVAFHPKKKMLATGAYGQVTIWDLEKMQPVKVLTSFLGAVNDVRFSPDGAYLAVGGGQPSAKGELRLFRVSDWKNIASARDHSDVVFSISFRPDNKELVSVSFDQTIRLWSLPELKHKSSIKGHSDFVYAVDFGPRGELLASVSKDRTVRLTETKTGKGRFTLGGMKEDVLSVAFHPNGKYVVSSGFESALYWWNTKTGTRDKLMRGHRDAVQELTFSKDGKLLVSASADGFVRIWNGVSGGSAGAIRVGFPVYAVDISSDNKWIATGTFDGFVRLWTTRGVQALTLLSVPRDDEKHQWLAQTPVGYVSTSKDLSKLARWTMQGRRIDDASAWKTLQAPSMVQRALKVKTLPRPKFEK